MIGECAVLCWLLSLAYVSGQAEIVKGIPDGLLRGTRTRAGEDSYVDAFLRIPYARPPVGDLRFRRPVAPERWSGVRDATNMAPKCPQPEIPIIPRVFPESEDCLYLNVFTPERPDDGWLLPVMVWIHGGGFYQGTGSNYDGTQLAAQGVVVVTINYRLGALGFLSTEDGASPGNYGLWDMIRALEWVRDSISALNGDPDNVTIFGQSAGSASVSLLLLTEAAKGLFHKAVMQSGVSLSPWSVGYPGFVPDPRGQSLKLAERLGCPTADNNGSRRMLQCLRNVDVNMLLNASMAVTFETRGTEAVFLPVPETSFGMNSGMFGGTPEVLFKSGFFFNVTTLRGFNKDEAGKGMDKTDPDDEGFTPDRFVKEVQLFVQEYFTQTSFTVDTDAIASLLIDAYVIKPNITDHQQLRDTFIQIQSDYCYIVPIHQELELTTKFPVKPQYLYRFSYRSPNRLNNEWQGVIHADELHHVFGYPVMNDVMVTNAVSSWTDDDRRMSEYVMALWTNFAKYGNPTPDDLDGVKWLPWTPMTPAALDISSSTHMIGETRPRQMRLWLDIMAALYRRESRPYLV